MRSRVVLPMLVLVFVASPAWAAIVLQADGRSVSAFGEPCTEPEPGQIECGAYESEEFTPSVPFAPFNASASAAGEGASQSSSMDALAGTMSAGGAASSFSDVGYASGVSLFEIEFSITTPTNIVLSGHVEADEYYGFGEGRAQVRLLQGTSVLYGAYAIVTGDYWYEDVIFDDVLAPGTYVIEALADGYGGSLSTYGLSFESTPVPEPGTASLVAAGLLALAAGRRRAGAPPRR